jgi:hypothetical protein
VYGAYFRHCCARSEGHAGSGVEDTTPSSTGKTMLDGYDAACPTS